MKRVWKWYNSLNSRVRSSISVASVLIGTISTVFTLVGFSLADCLESFVWRLIIVLLALVFVFVVTYVIIGCIYKKSVSFQIKSMNVEISVGDIFQDDGFKVIGCDNCFNTRADDVVIAKKSLQGQLILRHGKKEEIKSTVEKKAQDMGLLKNGDGQYEFPLGTVIRYDSSVDNQTYLMLAMTRLRQENGQFKAYTSMLEFEQMLRVMWKEIDGIYSYNDVVLPILGTGISRFEGRKPGKDALLKCMLCTLNSSGIEYASNVRVMVYGNTKDIPLYEFKNMFRSISWR